MKDLTIAKAAHEAGVGVETIRFYERRGLIEQPRKPRDSGFRLYSPALVKRIKFIRQAQQIGFSLHEIQELLLLRTDPAADCSTVRRQAVAKLEEVRLKIHQLRRIGTALEALIAVCPGRGGLQACTILDALEPDHGLVRQLDVERPLPAAQPKRRARNRKRDITNHQHEEGGMKSLTLKVRGMHCDGCANTIKALVEREPGVKTVSVSFVDGEARMLYDPATVSEDKLVALVEWPGYRVTGHSS
ncbi:MAG: MerR family transcriptional regulator [Alphaproteobacteria bacterium]|nr:MerR family transcriptional regulator [Alphaproteobacteria bacterium]